jgi:hypothetical protein
MIFAYTLEQVLQQQKSQTRRLAKPHEHLTALGAFARVEIPGKRVIYQVGKSYAVQPGRGKKSVARIIITAIRRENVETISEADALAEGFASREAFIETWRTIHKTKVKAPQDVWVLEFRLETIVDAELKTLYGQNTTKNGRLNHSHDIPASLAGVSGTALYSRDHPLERMGSPVSH